MTCQRNAFLPRLVAHLRDGGTHEIAGPCTGRLAWAATRLRIAPDENRRTMLQIQIETRTHAGLVARSGWSRCDWTIDELLSLRDEASTKDAVSTGMDEIECGCDAVVDAISALMDGGVVRLGRTDYVLDDESVSVVENGRLIAPDRARHGANAWIVLDR
jgi:hypothetical protein